MLTIFVKHSNIRIVVRLILIQGEKNDFKILIIFFFIFYCQKNSNKNFHKKSIKENKKLIKKVFNVVGKKYNYCNSPKK